VSGQDATGVRLMYEHEAACEMETARSAPTIAAVLRDSADCIIESTHALEGLENLEDDEQAILTQIVLGTRTARVFVALALTGQYESALAVARTLIEDGIACAYLAEHRDEAAKWRHGQIELRYGDMAAAVMEAHAQRDDEETPGEGAGWRRLGLVLRQVRRMLDDMSHANPARIPFVLTEHGYQLYPFFDRDALRACAWFGLAGLLQMLFFTRKWLRDYSKAVPACNSDDLRTRIKAVLDELETREAPAAASEPQV
jgi:hypothetical protein